MTLTLIFHSACCVRTKRVDHEGLIVSGTKCSNSNMTYACCENEIFRISSVNISCLIEKNLTSSSPSSSGTRPRLLRSRAVRETPGPEVTRGGNTGQTNVKNYTS
jgi:hypothetical protein